MSNAMTETKSPYPFLLRFVREFTHGTCLVGTEHEDVLGFCTREDARAWVEAINAKNARCQSRHRTLGLAPEAYRSGALTYRVRYYTIVEVGA